jgi:hypothetical protein
MKVCNRDERSCWNLSSRSTAEKIFNVILNGEDDVLWYSEKPDF